MKTENWKKTGLICWFERGIGGVCPSRRWQLNFCVLAVGLALLPLQAHPPHSHEDGRKIEFPDPPGYQTLVADLHQHTALSDGNVWPPI